MADINKNRIAKVDFNDSELTSTSPLSLIPRRGEGRDIRKKDISSLSRKRSKGLRVTDSLSSGAIISPGRPSRVVVPGLESDRYNKKGTSKLIREIEEEVEEVIEVDLEYVKILNQTWLKPIHPLGKCTLVVGRYSSASIVCRNKIIDCFDFNLKDSISEIYFRREKEFLHGEFVVIFKDKRQLTRKDLNLLNPDLIPSKLLPKFDKVWFKTNKSVNYTKFHELALQLELKVHHETIQGLNSLFITKTVPALFYGEGPRSTFLKARRERALDSEPIIDTKPRTRSMVKQPADRINTAATAEVIAGEDDQHENIDEMDQIRFRPDLNFKFEDKRTFTITNSDFKCLYNNYWINDNLIDFFLKLNLENSIKQNEIKLDQVLLLNSFFFTKLVKNENYYKNVKSWFKDDKLFSHRYIVIPVNQDLHWYCLIIHNLDKVYNDFKDEDISIEDDENLIEIFILDSLSQDHKSIKAPLVSFLTDYAKDKYEIDLTADKFKMYISPIPKQENFNDCGIHVIYNINIFLNKTDEFREIWKKPRKKFVNNKKLFLLADRQNLRMKLREELIGLLRSQELANGLADYDQVGKLTNKDFTDGESRIEEDVDEDDSDFEILGSINDENETSKTPTDENEREFETNESKAVETKSKYFPENSDIPSSTDSALIQDKNIDSFIEELETKVLHSKGEIIGDEPEKSPKQNEMNLLSNQFQKNTINSPNFHDFEAAFLKGDIDIEIGPFAKYVISAVSMKFTRRLINYLLQFEDVFHDQRFAKDLRLVIRYLNSLKSNESPDAEVMESFFKRFIEICETDDELTKDDDDTQTIDNDTERSKSEAPMESSEISLSETSKDLVTQSNKKEKSPGTLLSPVQRPMKNISAFLQVNRLKNQVPLPVRKKDQSTLINSSPQEEDDNVSSDLSEVNSDRIIAIDGDDVSLSKITNAIDISDSEDYENFNASVSTNRDKFMSKFPQPSEDAVEIINERRLLKKHKTKKPLKERLEDQATTGGAESYPSSPSLRNTSISTRRRNGPNSILSLLPIANRQATRDVAQSRGRGRKKQKIETLN